MPNSQSLRVALVSLLVMLWLPWQGAWAATVAGKVVFARGACAALVEGADNAPRLLGTDAEIYEGDVVQTGSDSFVVVEFADKARITIRPNSSFRVQKYATEGSQEAKLQLEKGAIRANVGQIAKNNPGKFQVETPVASVKSDGADFSARLCDKDCDGKQDGTAAKPDDSVGRVVLARGKVEAFDKGGAARTLVVGSPVFEQERVRSQADGYAALVFRDGSKTTVQPASEIEISTFQYKPGDTEHNKFSLRLLTGGFRALTGAIGKEKKENVQYATPVATIGIRGTLFYHHHLPAPIDGSPAGGYTHVNRGGVWQQTGAGSYDLGEGKTGYIANANSPQNNLPGQPPFMQRFENMTPSPEDVHADPALMFSAGAKPTLLVKVQGDGKVSVTGKDGEKTNLGDGQSSKTSQGDGTSVSQGGGTGDDGDDGGDPPAPLNNPGGPGGGGGGTLEGCS